MTNLSEHFKNIGGYQALGATPPATEVYRDVNGQIRVANSGVIIAGQPEVLSGVTITTVLDRGKTG